MSYMRFNFRSEELGRFVDVSIVYPTDSYSYTGEKVGLDIMSSVDKKVYRPGMKFQTVYLIHGGGDDDTLTYRYSNAERYAQKNNVMLVTPNLTKSFGVDTEYRVNYQSFLAKELPCVIQSLFASSPKREDNFIVGYAMGGNVALGTALRYPEKYCTCVDISGGIGMTLSTETLQEELLGDHFKNNFPIYNTTFGTAEKIPGSRFDLLYAAKQALEQGKQMPKFYLVCGEHEFIRYRVEKDVQILKELLENTEYFCIPGMDHDFEMWDYSIKMALDEWLPLAR